MHDLFWHQATVTREHRRILSGHPSVVLWFTGLSGAGKSTLAHAVEERLHRMRCHTFVFDGDNVRHGLCEDLGLSARDRAENIRRVGELARLFIEAGVIALTAFISPFRSDRARARLLVPDGEFLEIYCRCPLTICEERDVKGLYKRARSGEVTGLTGISSPYEEPDEPELIVDTGHLSLEESVIKVMELLQDRGVITNVA